MINKIAANIEVGPLRGQGDIGFEGVPDRPFTVADFSDPFMSIISISIGILTIVAGIWFIFKLITGALGIMAAGADKGKMAEARANITYGLVGFVLVVAAIFIAQIVSTILGVNFLDITQALVNITM